MGVSSLNFPLAFVAGGPLGSFTHTITKQRTVTMTATTLAIIAILLLGLAIILMIWLIDAPRRSRRRLQAHLKNSFKDV